MSGYWVYTIGSGEIVRQLQGPSAVIILNVDEGESCIPGLAGEPYTNYYVNHSDGKLHLKGDYSLSSLPLPCAITIEGSTYLTEAQPELEFDAPGSYLIEVDAGPRFLKKEFEYVQYSATLIA